MPIESIAIILVLTVIVCIPIYFLIKNFNEIKELFMIKEVKTGILGFFLIWSFFYMMPKEIEIKHQHEFGYKALSIEHQIPSYTRLRIDHEGHIKTGSY